jgi:hypothetical protein
VPGTKKRRKRPERVRAPRSTAPAPLPRPKAPEPDPDRYMGLSERFALAERTTRSTLQTHKLRGAEREAFERDAPEYAFRGDDLMHRTAYGYADTGIRALDFECIARNRAHWREAHNCGLPTRQDVGVRGPA